MFLFNNKGTFKEKSELYNNKTRNNSNLYQTSSHVTIYQKGPYNIEIKEYSKLPAQIKTLSCNITKFKLALLTFLQIHSFIIYPNDSLQ